MILSSSTTGMKLIINVAAACQWACKPLGASVGVTCHIELILSEYIPIHIYMCLYIKAESNNYCGSFLLRFIEMTNECFIKTRCWRVWQKERKCYFTRNHIQKSKLKNFFFCQAYKVIICLNLNKFYLKLKKSAFNVKINYYNF